GEVRAGDYDFKIGSAGSTTLVLQTILPALLRASGPSVVVIEGGTHNPLAPPFPFLERAYAPLLRELGGSLTLALERHGFYPARGPPRTRPRSGWPRACPWASTWPISSSCCSPSARVGASGLSRRHSTRRPTPRWCRFSYPST